MASSLAVSGVVGRLDQNARDILDQQVENRKGYLENSMVADWSDLTGLAEQINASAQALLEEGAISLETLDKARRLQPVLLQVWTICLHLRAKRATGIFVFLYPGSLTEPAEREIRQQDRNLHPGPGSECVSLGKKCGPAAGAGADSCCAGFAYFYGCRMAADVFLCTHPGKRRL